MIKILVVDDARLSRNVIVNMIRKAGHEVLTATNGREGLEKALAEKPDLIFSDMLMPVMDGLEMLEALRDKNVQAPVFMLTANIQETTRQQSFKLGASGFINKPIKEEELLKAIAKFEQTQAQAGMAATEDQLDGLKEIVNIGIAQAASVLNEMVDSHIELEVPAILIVDPLNPEKSLSALGQGKHSCVQLTFSGSFSGSSMLVFPSESAVKLVFALTGKTPGSTDLDAVMAGTLNEVGNIVVNSVMGAICNMLNKHLDYSLPDYLEGTLMDLLRPKLLMPELTIVLVETHFTVRDLRVTGNIFLILEVESLKNLLFSIDGLSS